MTLCATNIRAMTLEDYDAVIALMRATPGITVRDADSRNATAAYLARNPGCSNATAARYWDSAGWKRRDDIHRYSYTLSGNVNA